MKAYKDYMDTFSASQELQDKTIDLLRGYSSEGKDEKPITVQERRSSGRVLPIWQRAAVIIAAACLAFSAAAYAVIRYMGAQTDNADTGDSHVLVPAEDDFYGKNGAMMEKLMYAKGLDAMPVFDEETALMLSRLLEGKVFTEDGKPFELLTPVPDGFRADDRGYTLYDTDSREIGRIYYDHNEGEAPFRISVVTDEDEFLDTYDAAVAFLGRDFRLPAMHTEGFNPPKFKISIDDFSVRLSRVFVKLEGEPGMFYSVTTEGNATAEPENALETTVIWEDEVESTALSINKEVTVIKLSDERVLDGNKSIYTWTYDGLFYIFYQTNSSAEFTDEQCEDIIRSMIE